MLERAEPKKSPNRRIQALIIIMCLFGVVAIGKLVYVQVWQHGNYIEKATAQQSRKFIIPARRGQIFVQDGGGGEIYPIALNQRQYLLAADPKFIKDVTQVVEKIKDSVDADKIEEVKTKLSDKESRYVILNRRISSEAADKLKSQQIPGLIIVPQDGRNYPEGELFSHITGYVNNDGAGQYGVEQQLNQILAGTDGANKAVTDSLGVPITSSENTLVAPKNGSDVVLTIDRNLQAIASKAIEEAVTKNRAESGSIIIMDPKSGAVRAMVNYPSFDPNNYQAVKPDEYGRFVNSAISNQFEPGSGFKVITMAAGLDTGKVKPDTKYDDTGEVKVADKTIRNADNHKFGISTMTDVIQKSLNTGMVFVLRQLGTDPNKITLKSKEVLYDYINRFGFGEKTGIELAGEAKGYVKDTKGYDVDYANMTFGQGISATSLQMVNAIAAVANGGTLYKPYIVQKEVSPNGESKETKPTVVRDNVISSQAAAQLSVMMEQVVQHGSGWPTRMKGYRIAGKTGTAQVPRPDGQGYDEKKNIGSFVGFAPVEDPKFVMLVRVDYPKVEGFAEKTAVPTFAEVAKQLFIYYQVPPSGN